MAPEDNLKKRRTVEPETMLGSGRYSLRADYPVNKKVSLPKGCEVIIDEDGIGIVFLNGRKRKLPMLLMEKLFNGNLLEPSDEFELEDMEQEHDTYWNLQRASAQQTTRLSVGRILAVTAVGVVVLAVGVAVNNALKGRPIVEVYPAVAALSAGSGSATVVDEVQESVPVVEVESEPIETLRPRIVDMDPVEWAKNTARLYPSLIEIHDGDTLHMGFNLSKRPAGYRYSIWGTNLPVATLNCYAVFKNRHYPTSNESFYEELVWCYAHTHSISVEEARKKLCAPDITLVITQKPSEEESRRYAKVPISSSSGSTGSHSSNSTDTTPDRMASIYARISEHNTTIDLAFGTLNDSEYHVHGSITVRKDPSHPLTITIDEGASYSKDQKRIVFEIVKREYIRYSARLKNMGISEHAGSRMEISHIQFGQIR